MGWVRTRTGGGFVGWSYVCFCTDCVFCGFVGYVCVGVKLWGVGGRVYIECVPCVYPLLSTDKYITHSTTELDPFSDTT